MPTFDVGTQDAAGVPTPSTGVTTIFVDNVTKKLKSKDDAGVVMDYNSPGATSLAGDITGTTAASVLSDATATSKLLTGLVSASGTLLATDSILQAFGKMLGKFGVSQAYGNGADSDVIYSSDFTLVRDMYYNSVTINTGVTLFTGGFRIFSLNGIVNNGTIDRSGTVAAGNAAGAALVAGSLGGSSAGGAGGGAAAGIVGVAAANSAGGSGGAGGTGNSGGTAGGGSGVATAPTAALGGVEALNSIRQGTVIQTLSGVVMSGGGGGGGGGGSTVAASAGGGGSGAGTMVLAGRTITGTGVIRANGGAGAGGVLVNGGGGGGGGGGTIVTISETDTIATSLTFQVNGGAAGGGNGTGVSGNTGSVGKIVHLRS